MQATFRCEGSRVFVFGGTSGINLGIAEAFAEAGATVAVASRSAQKVEAAVSRLTDVSQRFGHGHSASGFSLDVRDATAVGAALDAFAVERGGIDVVVSGAAGNFLAPAATLTPNGFKAVVDIDLLGSFHACRAAFEQLKATRGCVIFISAGMSMVPYPYQVHVGAAKAGVDNMMRNLALEWGKYGVRSNSIVPGPIEGTEGVKRLGGEAWAATRSKTIPLGRYGKVEEIGHAAAFLASPLAAYVTGTALVVDGGQNLYGSQPFGMAIEAMLDGKA